MNLSFLTTVPVIFDKGINVWLGLVLLVLLVFQLATGFLTSREKANLFAYHRVNAIALTVLVLVHAYYGIGLWFFGFRYGG